MVRVGLQDARLRRWTACVSSNGRGIPIAAADARRQGDDGTGSGSVVFTPRGSPCSPVPERRESRGFGGPMARGAVVWARRAASFDTTARDPTVSIDGRPRLDGCDPPEFVLFRGHSDVVESVSVSRDGELLLTASRDGTARLWPLDGGAPVVLGEVGGPVVKFAAFSPDGTHVATSVPCGAEATPGVGRISVWPVAGGLPHTSAFPRSSPPPVAFSPTAPGCKRCQNRRRSS